VPFTTPYNQGTVDSDCAALILALQTVHVPMLRPTWFMAPATERYLMDLKNANGFTVFKDEMKDGTFKGYPYATTTQIPITLGGAGNQSDLPLVDMAQALIFDALALVLGIS